MKVPTVSGGAIMDYSFQGSDMADRRFVPLGFLFAGMIALAAALVPLIRGQSFNLSFGIFAGLFIVVAAVTWRRGEAGSRPDA